MSQSTTDNSELMQVAAGRDHLTTAEAARAMNRSPDTLRRWSCYRIGPIDSVLVNGRLMWRVSDIDRVLRGEK